MSTFAGQLRVVLETIKFQHSVFALPFAFTGALLALRGTDYTAAEIGWKFSWILVAMVAARSAAMAFNRLIDASIDAQNTRTATRAVPAGLLSKRFIAAFIVFSCSVFILAASQLNPLCLQLSPPAIAVVLGYSYTKRFTVLSHLVLGFSLGIAPAAAWIAIRNTFDPGILFLSAAVMMWTAGFDIIYSFQDVAFDRSMGLYSIPASLSTRKALLISRLMHVAMILFLVLEWQSMQLGSLGLLGIGGVAGLLVYEHSLVRADDLSRVNAAFFSVNGWISVLFFLSWAGDLWLNMASG